VWGSGVSYEISEAAREHESALPEMYANAYEADRPELFFNVTPSRTVGPGEAVGVRGDSDWNVPEPELGIVLYDGEVVGYTVGIDRQQPRDRRRQSTVPPPGQSVRPRSVDGR